MYTSYNYNGNSVVDYMIASESLISQVLYFNVSLNKPRLSDHSQISCKILANFSMRGESVPLLPFPVKYKWSEASSERFKDALCSCSIKQKILDLENLDANSSTDTLIGKLENIIIATADISLRKKCKKKSKKRHNPKKWYDYELYNMRRKLDQKGFLYAKYPCDPFVRGSYYKFRKLYVKLCKRKRKEYKGQIVEKLEQLHQKSLTKLRISAHKLEIENGRYNRKSVADRVCKKCNYNKVEDEIHFICECSLYNAERIRLFVTSAIPQSSVRR